MSGKYELLHSRLIHIRHATEIIRYCMIPTIQLQNIQYSSGKLLNKLINHLNMINDVLNITI